jgi:hypothetical protein
MIRISAFVWILVLGLLGVGLFQVKYNVQSKEVELRRINKQIEVNRAATHVLDAEWSYLNDPTRLADLTRRHTDLTPTESTQIKRFTDLPPRPATAQPDLPALSSAAPSTPAPTQPATTATQSATRVIPVSATPGSMPTAMPAVASTAAANGSASKATLAQPALKPATPQASTGSKTTTQAGAKPASTQAAKPGADEVIDAILADMQRQQTTPGAPAAGDQ